MNNKKYEWLKKKFAEMMNAYTHTPEAKVKMKEVKAGTKNPMYGKKHSEETRSKMGSNKGRKFSPEHCENMRKANLGKKLSEEHKAKISESGKRAVTPEIRAKVSAATIQMWKNRRKL